MGEDWKLELDSNTKFITLSQGERVTRRSTIWRRTQHAWQAVFHQGTVVAKS